MPVGLQSVITNGASPPPPPIVEPPLQESSSHPYRNRRATLTGRRTPPLPPRALGPHVRAVNHTGGGMIRPFRLAIAVSCVAVACRESPEPTAPAPPLAAAQSASNPNNPAWWNKYQYLAANGPLDGNAAATATTLGSNVHVSNECGPHSETFITLNPNGPRQLTAGSNEIFRLPMRAYFSSDGGGSWGGVDVPLPPALSGTNDTRFGSDPTLAFDMQGNVFYGFIVVFFSANFGGINGTELAVARSGDGGHSWPLLTEFSFQPGENHFNDKPMITVDQSAASRSA